MPLFFFVDSRVSLAYILSFRIFSLVFFLLALLHFHSKRQYIVDLLSFSALFCIQYFDYTLNYNNHLDVSCHFFFVSWFHIMVCLLPFVKVWKKISIVYAFLRADIKFGTPVSHNLLNETVIAFESPVS